MVVRRRAYGGSCGGSEGRRRGVTGAPGATGPHRGRRASGGQGER